MVELHAHTKRPLRSDKGIAKMPTGVGRAAGLQSLGEMIVVTVSR
jgi:hypothetical protein